MALEGLRFKLKGTTMKAVLAVFMLDGKTEARRKANIHVENFIRMAENYAHRFSPLTMIRPSRRRLKAQRDFKKRLTQKERVVDKCMREVMEETFVRHANEVPVRGLPPMTPKKIRSGIQKLMAKMNKDFQKGFREIEAGYEAAQKTLSGE